MIILVLNCGSSSVKYAAFDLADPDRGRPADAAAYAVDDAAGTSLFRGAVTDLSEDDFPAAIKRVLDDVAARLGGRMPDAIGHRVVHGGATLVHPVRVDDRVLAAIDAEADVAPLHNPPAAAAMRALLERLPDVPQVASFDTAFHARMPRRAVTYAIDPDVAERHGIRRYGFHGLSHEYVSGIAAGFLERPVGDLRLVTLHLGNGASACAVEFGRSAETSMGATPLEGLVMGTRSGDVDAGALLALLRAGYDVDALDDLLNRKSGLAGLSGISNDLREIEAAASDGNDRARLAINVFAHRARKYIGAYAAAMGGLDAIVFTGGIGENSASMRGRILQRLEFLGVSLDVDRNRDGLVRRDGEHALISTVRSRVKALVVKSNEELMIARHTCAVLEADRLTAVREPLQVPIAVSARHCHLTRATFERLFGEGAGPTELRPLSQPGQFACAERVNLIGPRARIDGVRLLGPLRDVDQIEIARSDEFKLGVDAPVRDSGHVEGSAPITLEGPAGTVELEQGLICAHRHIHMHPDDAARFGVADRDQVSVAVVGGPRDLVFGDVLIRVSTQFSLEMHIDTDEANAAQIGAVRAAASGGVDGAASVTLAHTDVDEPDYPHEPVYATVRGAHACLNEADSDATRPNYSGAARA